jgi:ABC-type branched-subunit amino acid transport system ATPase component
VVLTEQIAAVALKVATDVHVLRQGRTVYTGDAKKMLSEGRSGELSSLYLG